MFLGVNSTGMIYSVAYDGSAITYDNREVERENYFISGLLGFSYRYHDFFSVGPYFQASTDLIKGKSIPDPVQVKIKPMRIYHLVL
jgi:hypothetical protein